MVTIKDVAKAAGVSPSTVSRVVKNHPGISSDTKRKIRKIMEQMGYTPHVAARNLVTKRSYTIGLVVKSAVHEAVLNPFFTEVNFGVSEACRTKGFSTIMTAAEDDDSLFLEVKNLINSKRVDGFILLYSKENDPVTKYLTSMAFPFVVIGKDVMNSGDAIHVDNDNVQAAKEMTDLLIDEGYEDIVMVVDNEVFAVSQDRIAGFEQAMASNGLSSKCKVVQCDKDESSIERMLVDLFDHTPPQALLTLDGVLNARIISRLYQMQIRIPEDVATATFSESPLTKFAAPPQTVVDIYPKELGKEASNEVIMLIKDDNRLKRNITVPTRIIERQSTKKEERG
ncbi:LacI family DNA-binding transcriptional regulator [Salinicoccus jeotgali]|uniref:LacI family DNA-binding transcriptional regulator n=1 Tax=Salinicoccus jeotgali TaxID=381634 RepID=A0ABP7EM09_9STAP